MKHRMPGIAAALLAAWCVGGAMAAPEEKGAPLALGLKSQPAYTASRNAARPMGKAPIPNFGEVAPGCIYRSAQPNEAGFAWLKSQGFRSIVCLRKEHDDDAERMARLGFRYLYLPIVDQQAPTVEQAETFLRFAADRSNWPLLLHCAAGRGRAGTMAALVRYSFDGWAMGLALQEARRYRPLKFPMFGAQKAFLRRWASTHPRGSFRPKPANPPGGEDTGE